MLMAAERLAASIVTSTATEAAVSSMRTLLTPMPTAAATALTDRGTITVSTLSGDDQREAHLMDEGAVWRHRRRGRRRRRLWRRRRRRRLGGGGEQDGGGGGHGGGGVGGGGNGGGGDGGGGNGGGDDGGGGGRCGAPGA